MEPSQYFTKIISMVFNASVPFIPLRMAIEKSAIINPEWFFGRRPTKKPLPTEEKKRRVGHTILSLPAGPGGS
jgi:hypothetical protein